MKHDQLPLIFCPAKVSLFSFAHLPEADKEKIKRQETICSLALLTEICLVSLSN